MLLFLLILFLLQLSLATYHHPHRPDQLVRGSSHPRLHHSVVGVSSVLSKCSLIVHVTVLVLIMRPAQHQAALKFKPANLPPLCRAVWQAWMGWEVQCWLYLRVLCPQYPCAPDQTCVADVQQSGSDAPVQLLSPECQSILSHCQANGSTSGGGRHLWHDPQQSSSSFIITHHHPCSCTK